MDDPLNSYIVGLIMGVILGVSLGVGLNKYVSDTQPLKYVVIKESDIQR